MEEQQSAELIAQRQIAAAIVAQQAAASSSNTASLPQYHVAPAIPAPGAGGSKYQHLLAFIEELGKDTRPTYNGNRNCQERLKRGIGQARLMVRECMAELELAAKKQGGGQ